VADDYRHSSDWLRTEKAPALLLVDFVEATGSSLYSSLPTASSFR
jgi:hypothetical protein